MQPEFTQCDCQISREAARASELQAAASAEQHGAAEIDEEIERYWIDEGGEW